MKRAICSLLLLLLFYCIHGHHFHFRLTLTDEQMLSGGRDDFQRLLDYQQHQMLTLPGMKEMFYKHINQIASETQRLMNLQDRGIMDQDDAWHGVSDLIWDFYEDFYRQAGMKLIVDRRPHFPLW